MSPRSHAGAAVKSFSGAAARSLSSETGNPAKRYKRLDRCTCSILRVSISWLDTVCADGTSSHGGDTAPPNKVSAIDATRPGNRIFLSYIGLPHGLDGIRVLRFGNEFKVQDLKLASATTRAGNFEN